MMVAGQPLPSPASALDCPLHIVQLHCSVASLPTP